jgi:hypothetical protein
MARTRELTRRSLMRNAALGTLALATGAARTFGQTRSRPPSIVFIMADDLGYADVSCYGRPDFRTPNIDRIAARGIQFFQGYANSAVCSATRTALITGRYQYRLRLGLEEPLGPTPDIGLPPEHPLRPVNGQVYKANHQRAMRDGDFKYLKILDNAFLFNVAAAIANARAGNGINERKHALVF